MYTYEGFEYTDEEVQQAANKANLSIKDYTDKNNITLKDKDPEPKIKDGDLLDPNFQQGTPADADVVQQPMTASQAGFTESPSVDTPSESQDPEPKSKRLIDLERKLEKAKTFKTPLKGSIIADLNDEIRDAKLEETPEYKKRRYAMDVAVNSVFSTNGIYDLGIEGGSVTELINDPNFSTKLRNKVIEKYESDRAFGKEGTDLPTSWSITTAIQSKIDSEINKEAEALKEERVKKIDYLRKNKSYTATLQAGVEQDMVSLTSKQQKIAKTNVEIKRLKAIIKDGSLAEQSEAAGKLTSLIEENKANLKSYNENYRFLIDPNTGENLSFSQEEKNLMNNTPMLDLGDKIKEKSDDLRKEEPNVIQEAYVLHHLERQNLEKLKNTIVKLKPDNFNLRNILQGRGIEPNQDGIYEAKYKDLMGLRNVTDVDKLITDAHRAAVSDGSPTLIQSGFKNVLDDIYKETVNLKVDKEAFATMYLMNIDPGSIKTGGISKVGEEIENKLGEFFGSLSKSVFGEKITESIGTTRRMELDALENIQKDFGIPISKSQRDNYKRSIATQVIEGTAAFIPEIGKFMALGAATNPILAFTRFGLKMAEYGKKTATVSQRLKHFAYMAALEEIKFKTVTAGQSHTGGGAGFYSGGLLANKILQKLRFTGKLAAANPFLDKVVKGGIGGTAGSEGALITEEGIKAVLNNTDWKEFVKQNYGTMYYDNITGGILSDAEAEQRIKDGKANTMTDESLTFQKMIVSFGQFSMIQGSKLKKYDFMSIAKKRNLHKDIVNKLNEQNEKGDLKIQGLERQKKINIATVLKTDLIQADKSFYDQDVSGLVNTIKKAKNNILSGELTSRQKRLLEKEIAVAESKIEMVKLNIEKSFKNIENSGIFGNNKIQLEIVKGDNAELDGAKARYIPTKKRFVVNLLNYKKGVLSQEYGHSLFDLAFKNNPKVAEQFEKAIKKDVNKAFEGDTFKSKDGRDITFEEAIADRYSKTDKSEEYVMNVVEFLQAPENKERLLNKKLLPSLNRTLNTYANKIGVDLRSDKPLNIGEKNVKRGSDLLEFLYDLGNIESNASPKTIKNQLEKLKNIEIEGDKIVDSFTGREVKTEAESLKDFASEDLKADNKDIFSKINKVYKEGVEGNQNIETTGVMVGFEYRPIVLKKIRRYIDKNNLQVASDVPELLADAVIMEKNGVPGIVKSYSDGQKVIKYIKENNPSKQEIQDFAKENGIREIRSQEGASRLDKLEAMAKGTKAEATLTSMITGDVDKRILGIMQKPEYAQEFGAVRLGGLEENQQEKIVKESTSGEGSTAFLDLAKNDRVSRKTAIAVSRLPESINDKATEIAEKTLMQKFPKLGARTLGKVKLKSGEEVTYALFRNTADVTIGSETFNIKARGFKEINDYITSKGLSTEGKPSKLKNFNQYQQEAFKVSLFKEIEKEAGKLKGGGKIPTPEYNTFVDNTFKLYKNYISQSSINKRFNIFSEPLIDPKTGKQVRESSDQGNPVFKKKNITPAEWKKYFGGDGTGTERLDGKRRSLIETIAMEIGKDAIMEKLESDTFKKIVEERQTELDNEVGENFISKVSIELDRLPSGEMSKSLASTDLYKKILKIKEFAVENENEFRTLINQFTEGKLDETLSNQLKEVSKESFIDTTQAKALIAENVKQAIGQGFLKSETDINIRYNEKLGHSNKLHKEFRNEAESVLELIPREVLELQRTFSGERGYIIAETFGYDGGMGKSTQQFIKDFDNILGSKADNSIWKPVFDLIKKNKQKFFAEISGGSNKTGVGQAKLIIKNNELSNPEKMKGIDNIYEESLKDSNELNTVYHNAIIKSLYKSLNTKYEGNLSERIEAVERLSPMIAQNKKFGFRLASPFTIFELNPKGGFSNEHLKESVKYKSDLINLLKKENIDIDSELKRINTGYESALVDNTSRTAADRALGSVFSPEMKSYLKLIGPDALVFTAPEIANKLNNFYHAPSKKLLGDYIVEKFIKESTPANKSNLKILKDFGVDTKQIKSNTQALAEIDKIEFSINKKTFSSVELEKNEIEIFHGGDIRSVKDVEGFAYFSENKNQAEAYAKGNQGEVKSFVIDKTSIATESQVVDVINALGIKPRNGWKVDESHLYELIDPRFEQSFSKKDREKLAVALKKKGIKAARFTDINIAQGKDGGRETENIVVFDSKTIKEPSLASLDLNKTFNKIIEGKTGIKADDVYSKSRGVKAGKGKGRFDIIPPSAEDFVGLLYKTLGKGKEGDAQMDFYKKHLIDPFARGDEAITNERNALMRDFKQVKKEIVESIGGTNWKGVSPLTKKLKNKIGDQDYTGEDAVRMYIWRKQGMEIPEIDKAEVDAAISSLAKDPILVDFANKIRTINRGRPYTAPEKGWAAGNIATDFLSGINTEGRAKHLEEWQANVDAVFSKENLNKLEGAFGTNYRKAMENMLKRMKSGKNRDVPKDKLSGRVTDWINNSTGAIMFFNQRSSVLQLMSATNFVNLTDNNIFKAGTAFANQPQYWKDFKTLFNSEYLKNRRGGLEFNVTESEIADLAKQGGVRGVISKILKVGFTPTQIADSFAIASGGATFFRNRFKTYLNETNAEGEKVYTEKEAKEKAFLDFKETAEESQQSSRPDKISQQQASDLGRLVLSFANTPSQYARIIKKATLDLKDGRGDKKTNISKIAYYTFLTNLVFNGLQKALFIEALNNTDDDERSDAKKRKEQEKRQSKYLDVANGMISSYLRGTGVRGNVISTLKDMGLEVYKQQGKTVQDYDRVADAALGFSPPVRYKYIQMKSAGRKFTYPGSREEIMNKGFSLENPALMAGAQYTSALTNVPLDRALKKINNIVLSTNSELEEIQRIGLVLGWSAWDLGIEKPKKKRRGSSNKRKSSIKKSSIRRSTIK